MSLPVNKVVLFRVIDVALAGSLFLMFLPLIILLTALLLTESRRPIFVQKRVGIGGKVFSCFKFRTMKLATSDVPTHLVDLGSITCLGRFLRKHKLDELPQLINVLRGDMSLVGPRPGLVVDEVLSDCRSSKGILSCRPGITGLGQIIGVDMSDPQRLARVDARMIQSMSFYMYWIYLLATACVLLKIPPRKLLPSKLALLEF